MPGDRRCAFGPHDSPRDQILKVGKHREPGGADQSRIDPDIDCAHERRDIGLTLPEPVQDRFLATFAVADVTEHVSGKIRCLTAPGQL